MERKHSILIEYLSNLFRVFPELNGETKSSLSRTVCGQCGQCFISRNDLFKHLAARGHGKLCVCPRGYRNKFSDQEFDQETYCTDFARWLLTPTPTSVVTKPIIRNHDHRFKTSIEEYHSKPKYGELVSSTIFSLQETKLPECVYGCRLDSGDSIFSLIVARCILASKGKATRMFLLNLCREAQAHIDVLDEDGIHSVDQRFWFPPSFRSNQFGDASISPLEMARQFKDLEIIESLLGLNQSLSTHPLNEPCSICVAPSFLCCDARGNMQVIGGCGHRVCKPMLADWIAAQVENQCGIDEIKCTTCPQLLSEKEVYQSATPNIATRAERVTLEKALLKMGDWVWCPVCPSGGFRNGCGEGQNECHSVFCVDCDHEFCPKCFVAAEHHRRLPSIPFPKSSLSAAVTKGSAEDECKNESKTVVSSTWLDCGDADLYNIVKCQKWLTENSKLCPKEFGGCGVPTQRNGGCSHMKCHLCKFDWCWICGGKYKGGYTFGDKCTC